MNTDYINVKFPTHLSGSLIGLLQKQRDKIAEDVSEGEASLAAKKEELMQCEQLIAVLLTPAPEKNLSEYSANWRVPLKTVFILKNIIKRPASAKEIIRAIEMQENGFEESRKTTVYSALANQATSGTLVRTKPGNEYLYCHPDHATADRELLSYHLKNAEME